MLSLAVNEGVLTHKRAPEYCDEKTKTFGEVVEHICRSIEADDILWATCTSPLVTPELYSAAIKKYYESVPAKGDSVVSFEMIKRYLWDDNGPINYELGIKHVPSQ
jgi:N-acylneuraminate cytidylyltransferase